MSMSEFPSSSALSQCALMLNDSDSDTLIRTTSETDSESSEGEFAGMPIMRPRQHVLDDMPEDVKHYWLYKYVLNWHTSSPMDIAKMLHRMATISKTHQLEVNYVVQNDYEISLAYTAHAMRVHAEMAIALPPKKKIRARRHLENTGQLVNEYKIYSTVSINLSSDERKEFNQPEWLRAAAQELLSPTSKVKRITFDFSIRREPLDPRNGRYTIFNKNFRDEYHDVPTTDEEGVGSAMKVLASVARKIKQSNMGERPVIKLIIKNNLTALREIEVLPSTLPIELLDASGARAGGRRVDQSSAGSSFFLLINRVDIRSLSIYLAKNPCGLKTLILHDCNLDSSALEELSAGLAKNTSVKTLDLSKNFIRRPGVHGLNTFAGLQTFAQMLATSTTLHHVNLVNCRLRDLGADLLHQSLKANGYLQTLNLSSNVIPATHPIWGDTRVIGNAVKQVD